MSVASLATFCLIKLLNFHEISLFMPCNDHLGYALAIAHHKVLLRQIDQHDTYLTAIVGIDGSWRVQHGNSMFQGQSATWADLCLISFGQCDMKTCGYEPALHRVQGDRFIEISPEVHTGTQGRSIFGQLLMPAIDHLNLYHTLQK